MTPTALFRLAFVAVATLAASPAFAHAGHAFTFAAGLSHPLTGLDHLLAMALVGLWASAFGGARAWAWPVAFVASLTAGAILGHEGFAAPGVETMIALSVTALGVLVALRAPASLALGVAVLAPLGVAHGLAHGAEAPSGAFAPYAAGFILASAALHAGGLTFGRYAAQGARWIGAASALAGLWLAVG
jgi:urease accessory protein